MLLISIYDVFIIPVESCAIDDPLNAVYLQQTTVNASEYRVSCQTGYQLMYKENLFTCQGQQWSPYAPSCVPVMSDTTLIYTSSTGEG